MKKQIFLLLCCFSGTISVAQTADWAIGINKWYTKEEGINWLIGHFRPIYDFRPNEKVASIGAGQGVCEVVFSLMADSLTFYLQDLNPYWLESERLLTTVQTIYKQAGRMSCLTTFIPIRGTEKETRLPAMFFDKIIIENSLHEFNFQADMLQSIRHNLKSNGVLLIWEAIATKPNRKHVDCGKPMFTDETLIKLLTDNGFRFVNKTVVDAKRGNNAVFKFCLSK